MRTRAVVMGLGLGLGCRSAAPVQAPVAPVEDAPPVVTSMPVPAPVPPPQPVPAPTSGRVAEGASALALQPPPPQRVVPVKAPFSPQAAVMMPMTTSFSVVLFEDETTPIRRKVARNLAARGHRVVPFDELERIEAGAAEGRLVLEDDIQCRAPLTRAELHERYFAGAPEVVVDAHCYDGDCRLQVTGSRGEGDDWEHLYSYSSRRVRRPHDPASWRSAELRPTNGIMGGIVGGIIGSSHPPPIIFGSIASVGPWEEGPDEPLLRSAKVGGCAHPDPRVHIEYDVRMAVEADGHLGRCEAVAAHPRAGSDSAECLCRALEDAVHPAGKPGRRLRVELTDPGQGHFSSLELTQVQPGTQSWITRLVESSALEICVAETSPPSDFEATAVLGLHPDGRVHEARIFGEIDQTEEIRFSQCMVRRLKDVPLPCAPPGIDELQVRIAPPGP